MQTPWERAKRTQSQSQEESLAKRDPKGRLQMNSGRTSWTSKRDLIIFDFLVEARTTASKSHSINALELEQLTRNAFFHRSLPAMALQFTEYNQEWLLMRQKDFEQMQASLGLMQDEIESLKRELASIVIVEDEDDEDD